MKRVMFKPARELRPEQILGDCCNGEVWLPWRCDANGEAWYRRHDAPSTVTPEAAAARSNTLVLCGVPAGDKLHGVPSAIHRAEFLEANE